MKGCVLWTPTAWKEEGRCSLTASTPNLTHPVTRSLQWFMKLLDGPIKNVRQLVLSNLWYQCSVFCKVDTHRISDQSASPISVNPPCYPNMFWQKVQASKLSWWNVLYRDLLKMYAVYQIHGLPNIQEADESGTSSSSVASVKWLPILTQSNVLIPSQFFRWVHGCSTSRLVWWWSSPRIRAGESFSEFLKDDLMIVLYVCQLSCRNHMWALNDSVGE